MLRPVDPLWGVEPQGQQQPPHHKPKASVPRPHSRHLPRQRVLRRAKKRSRAGLLAGEHRAAAGLASRTSTSTRPSERATTPPTHPLLSRDQRGRMRYQTTESEDVMFNIRQKSEGRLGSSSTNSNNSNNKIKESNQKTRKSQAAIRTNMRRLAGRESPFRITPTFPRPRRASTTMPQPRRQARARLVLAGHDRA